MEKKRLWKFSFFLLVLSCVAIFILNLNSFLYGSSLFKTDVISLSADANSALHDKYADMRLRLSKEVNILQLNLTEVSVKLRKKFPELDNMVLARALPNRLSLSGKIKLPVARLAAGSGAYLLDSEGIILGGGENDGRQDYPILICPRIKLGDKPEGKKCNYDNVQKALKLLSSLKEKGIFARYKIMKFDIADSKDIKFLVESIAWVRMGNQDFDVKLDRLAEVLPELVKAAANRAGQAPHHYGAGQVKYIDLRFGDVIVGTK